MTPEKYYTERLERLQKELERLFKKKSLLAWLRFTTVMVLIVAMYFLFPFGWMYCLGAAIFISIIFIRLLFTDLDNKKSISHSQHLIRIVENELKALQNDHSSFENGTAYIPKDHPYANDLDIFGNDSLFQMINRTTSEMGSRTLASWLSHPSSVEIILERQDAVKELTIANEWRETLQALGKEKKININTQQRIRDWLLEEHDFFSGNYWKWMRYFLPSLILLITLLSLVDIIPYQIRNLLLLGSSILAYIISKKVSRIHIHLSKIADELSVMKDSIELIEKTGFKNNLLKRMRSNYLKDKNAASATLQKLNSILERFDLRYNPLIFIPLDIILQWDLQQVLDLNKWKADNKQQLMGWFDTLGEFEALNSFATIHFNQPHWCFASFKEPHFEITGTAIGHPLIGKEKCVPNDIHISKKGEVMLITGSNMAGKSTYLRSIGINTVLAMAGSPVCARSFTLSPVQVISSMRIADNLQESTSTFYAELKKLKTIIDKVNNNERIFILLDEILRGTNSLDRHTGSVALIHQLIKREAACIIATHDVELAQLKEDYPGNLLNYHFDVEVNKEELYFDYKLKTGICTSLNASILMKKIGIEM